MLGKAREWGWESSRTNITYKKRNRKEKLY